MVKIVGLYSESSGHGKDTVAKLFLNNMIDVPKEMRLTFPEIISDKTRKERLDLLNYCQWELKKFATAPKKIVADICGVPIEMMEDREWRLQKHPVLKESPLHFLIKISEYIKTISGEDIWANTLINSFQDHQRWLITDVRFPVEYNAIKAKGGVIFKVHNPDCKDPVQAMDGLLNDYTFDETILNVWGKQYNMMGYIKHCIEKYEMADLGKKEKLIIS